MKKAISLGEAFPKEQARVRECLAAYREIGPSGIFAATWIEELLQRADQVVMSGDVVEMIKIYKELQEVKT